MSDNFQNRIRITTIGIGVLYLGYLIYYWASIKNLMRHHESFFSFIFIVTITILVVPAGLIYFWRGQKQGWVIICGWCVLNFASVVYLYAPYLFGYSRFGIRFAWWPFLLWGVAIVYLNLNYMTRVFQIGMARRVATFFVSVLLLILFVLLKDI